MWSIEISGKHYYVVNKNVYRHKSVLFFFYDYVGILNIYENISKC